MKLAPSIQFGTDGWRAVIADDFTFGNVALVAQATADAFRQSRNITSSPRMIVGYDRRYLSDQFATLTAEILVGNGYFVTLTDRPTPTPAISHAVKARGAVGGVMITASHNPGRFNGYKLKMATGGPADGEDCQRVEACLGQSKIRRVGFDKATGQGSAERVNLLPHYFKTLKSLVDFPLVANTSLRLAHEPLHGVGAGCFDQLLAKTRCDVRTFHADHDPNFGGLHPEPIEKNYGPTAAELRRRPADFCLVTDGDADRIGAMDGHGRPLTTHQVICLLLRHFIINRQGKGRVVKALTTTSMVDKICIEHGLELTVTGVGFKYICAEMLKGDVLLGFEESGGIGFPSYVPERDGILAGLMVLEMLAMEGVSINRLLSRLERRYGPHCYGRIDTNIPIQRREAMLRKLRQKPPDKLGRSVVARADTFDGIKLTLHNDAWLMLRGSGTEPILRIYAEAPTETERDHLLRLGKRLAWVD